MPFQYVLANLLADHPDAVGVLFIDDTGETVDFACSEESPYEMQLLGAYLGIYLRQVSNIVSSANLGSIHWFHIERRRRHLHVTVLPDGYFLVLVQRQPAQIATARESLRRAAIQLKGRSSRPCQRIRHRTPSIWRQKSRHQRRRPRDSGRSSRRASS